MQWVAYILVALVFGLLPVVARAGDIVAVMHP